MLALCTASSLAHATNLEVETPEYIAEFDTSSNYIWGIHYLGIYDGRAEFRNNDRIMNDHFEKVVASGNWRWEIRHEEGGLMFSGNDCRAKFLTINPFKLELKCE